MSQIQNWFCWTRKRRCSDLTFSEQKTKEFYFSDLFPFSHFLSFASRFWLTRLTTTTVLPDADSSGGREPPDSMFPLFRFHPFFFHLSRQTHSIISLMCSRHSVWYVGGRTTNGRAHEILPEAVRFQTLAGGPWMHHAQALWGYGFVPSERSNEDVQQKTDASPLLSLQK